MQCQGAARYAVPCRATARVDRLTCHNHDRQEPDIRARARHEVIVALWAWVCELDPNTNAPIIDYLTDPTEAQLAVIAGLERRGVAA